MNKMIAAYPAIVVYLAYAAFFNPEISRYIRSYVSWRLYYTLIIFLHDAYRDGE